MWRACQGVRVGILRQGRSVHQSALFITGETGVDRTNVVIPELPLPPAIESWDVAALVRNLQIRKTDPELDVSELKSRLMYIHWMKTQETQLEAILRDLRLELNQLSQEPQTPGRARVITEKRECSAASKSELKQIRVQRWQFEEVAALDFLKLPNVLSPETPAERDRDVHARGVPPDLAQPRSHLDLAGESVFWAPHSPSAYYLLGPVARLEQSLIRRACAGWEAANGIAMSSPDFTRSVVVEGCGRDFMDPRQVLALTPTHDFKDRASTQGMHLVGGASLYTMASFLSKNVIRSPLALPQTFFVAGRQYHPVSDGDDRGLFSVQQSMAVQVLHVCESEPSAEEQFSLAQNVWKEFFDGLDVHYKFTLVNATQLHSSESKKMNVSMFSPWLQEYIHVGDISLFGDFLSKRLMFKYGVQDQSENVHVVSGTFANITRLVACIIENRQKEDGTVAFDV
eukprot:maker-scaffold247_size239117-snap-gene-1.25 protein:Tk09334 transcript:maker-scaffold247_size239117-snap-gene-1.25-mRNA-1 annotation:"serine--trna mitochondrial"